MNTGQVSRVFHLDDRGIEPFHEADLKHQSFSLGHTNQGVRRFDEVSDRFFHEEMNACREHVLGHFVVLFVGTAKLTASTCDRRSWWSG